MFSISFDSCKVKENEEAAQAIVDDFSDLVSGLGRDSSLAFSEVEDLILERTQALRQKLFELHVSDQASVKETDPVSCPTCGKACRPWRKRGRQFTTLCGDIGVERWVYYCEDNHYHFPWDRKQKLKGKYTHRVAELMCFFAAHFDYRMAADAMTRLGVSVSHTTLHKKVCEWTKDVRALEEVECQTLAPNEHWIVSTDGCHTNSPGGWKETKVSSILRTFPHLGPNGIARARPESIRYTASRQNAIECGKDLYALATRSGIYQEDVMDQEIVFIGDGAAWIWNLADEHFPNAVQVVDIMHAKSHLYDVAKAAFGEVETEKIKEWIEEVEPLLQDGNITEVVACIRGLSTKDPDTSEILEREARYFQKHAKRMQYKLFREKGYMIGSGVIESACKHLVAQRCRRASMRWTDEGLQSILELRCMYKNKTWQKYWYPDPVDDSSPQKIDVSTLETRAA